MRRLPHSIISAVLPLLALVSAPAAPPQTGAAPRFEVASIKPTPPTAAFRTPMKTNPARVVYNSFSLKLLIQLAYKASDWEITGGPSWLDTDHYDVEATLPPGSSQDQVPEMLQALLAERFHLVLAHETRRMAALELVTAKNGPKLKPGDTAEQWSGGTMKGGIFKGRILLHQLTMLGLAEVLSGQTGSRVIDKTHLSGIFDIDLKWTPDDVSQPNNLIATGPSLYTALEEQLGLKLTATKADLPILVVTHAEKPSEN
jgi:uncharacterized protein (TIGR03435 family)